MQYPAAEVLIAAYFIVRYIFQVSLGSCASVFFLLLELLFTFCGLVTCVYIEMLQRKHILSS